MGMYAMKKRIFTVLLTILFLGVMFGGLFYMSTGMDIGRDSNMSECLFKSRGETLCSMNILDHFGVWKSNFLAVVPTFTLLLGVLAAALIFLAVAPHLIFSKRKLLYETFVLNRNRDITIFSGRPLQELFSNGILHPKLF